MVHQLRAVNTTRATSLVFKLFVSVFVLHRGRKKRNKTNTGSRNKQQHAHFLQAAQGFMGKMAFLLMIRQHPILWSCHRWIADGANLTLLRSVRGYQIKKNKRTCKHLWRERREDCEIINPQPKCRLLTPQANNQSLSDRFQIITVTTSSAG